MSLIIVIYYIIDKEAVFSSQSMPVTTVDLHNRQCVY